MVAELKLTPANLLPDVVAIAVNAGEAILQVYERTSFDVQDKADNSPVTEADILAHNIIIENLATLPVHFPVLSEESLKIPAIERQQWPTYWLVDPLDGTREFVKRNDEFSVNIALIHQHQSILGVIYAPVTGATYLAAEGYGAYKTQSDALFHKQAIQCRLPDKPPIIFGSRSHGSSRLQRFLDAVDNYQLKHKGSSLKSCCVAEGDADLYIRFGPTSEWDTAAAQCIVEQAGGCIIDLNLQPLSYNRRDSLLNPEFLVCEKTSVAQWAQHLPEANQE